MRYSELFGKSVRSASQSIGSRGHEYLFRGGFIRESSAGRFYMLPLGMRVQEKICRIIAEEMETAGAQRVSAPTLHPLELWEETSRSSSAAFELMQVADRSGRKFVLGGTAEEMMVELVRKFDLSARDLPFCIYQFSQKFRDELRVRAGLLRCREFLMKDAYSFHATKDDFAAFYERMKEAYLKAFSRLGLQALVVESDNGYMGGEYCHELVVEHELGESRFLVSEDGSYAAHEDVARFERQLMNGDESPLPLEVRKAERGISIEAGVNFYGQPAWRQIKTIIFVTDSNEKVLVSVRGDLEINETKLMHVLNCSQLRLATEDDVRDLGSCVGFVSPLKIKIRKIGDTSLTTVRNFYTGADEWHRDTVNVNYGRDFTVDILADIATAREGDLSAAGGKKLRAANGIEVGNIFQLGTWYSERMKGAEFTGEDGKKHPFYMGCYGIGIGRSMAAIAECHNDERGLIWPKSAAPYQVHLLSLCTREEDKVKAEKVYQDLLASGIEVLYDDRLVSAGVKFADADLIGIPQRVVISKKTLSAGMLEYRWRNAAQDASSSADLDSIIAIIKS